MKDHWNTLPPEHPLRRRIERELAADVSNPDAWRSAAGIAFAAGYDTNEPPQAFLAQLVTLRISDPRAAGRFTSERSVELASEKAAARIFAGRRAWAKGPPQSEIDAKRSAAKTAAEAEVVVEARAQQLVAEQAAKNLESARQSVRRKMVTK